MTNPEPLLQRTEIAKAVSVLAAVSAGEDYGQVYWLRKWHAAEADRLNYGGAPNEDYTWIDHAAEDL